MNPGAHVTSIPALAEFRAGLCTFIDQAKDALVTLDMEIRRTLDWLNDQAAWWKAEIRAAEDAVTLAKNDLARKRMMGFGDRPPDCTEQEEALKRACQRLDHSQEKLAATKRWLFLFPDEVREYEGPSRLLQGALEGEMPRMVALLEYRINALEAYTQIKASPPQE